MGWDRAADGPVRKPLLDRGAVYRGTWQVKNKRVMRGEACAAHENEDVEAEVSGKKRENFLV